jgi:hypothetical protein
VSIEDSYFADIISFQDSLASRRVAGHQAWPLVFAILELLNARPSCIIDRLDYRDVVKQCFLMSEICLVFMLAWNCISSPQITQSTADARVDMHKRKSAWLFTNQVHLGILVLPSVSQHLDQSLIVKMRAGQALKYLSFWKPLGVSNDQIQLANPHTSPSISTRPNIIFILTDDQDLHLQSLNYMPLTQKHLTDQGTFYKRHYCTVAVCCPSRVSLWTGKAGENLFNTLGRYADGK